MRDGGYHSSFYVRRIWEIASLFESKLLTEESFQKNRVSCAFATSDNSCTLGFAVSGRPKSLMKSNELSDNAKKVDLIFRKPRDYSAKYADLHFGDKEKIQEYKESIESLISEKFFSKDGDNSEE